MNPGVTSYKLAHYLLHYDDFRITYLLTKLAIDNSINEINIRISFLLKMFYLGFET